MIIEDKMMPQGMFSKAGRYSLEKFALLQEKEYIMTGKKKRAPSQNELFS